MPSRSAVQSSLIADKHMHAIPAPVQGSLIADKHMHECTGERVHVRVFELLSRRHHGFVRVGFGNPQCISHEVIAGLKPNTSQSAWMKHEALREVPHDVIRPTAAARPGTKILPRASS